MTGLLAIETVEVPATLVEEAHAHLHSVGMQGLEGFALWAGLPAGTIFRVTHTLIPSQTGRRLAEGVCVTVDGAELHRLNVWLFEHGLTLLAQLHSHPGAAYHSDTDDAYPIATTLGCLSLVEPDFATGPFSLARCAVYRLLPGRGWVRLRTPEVRGLIKIVG